MINFCSVDEVYMALENEPEALIIPKCDSALIGTYKLERDNEQVIVSCYDYDLLINYFAEEFSVDCEDNQDPVEQAIEWVDFNIVGAYHGKFTPVIVYKEEDDYVII